MIIINIIYSINYNMIKSKMRILYIVLFNSGNSRDMFLASLLGLVQDYNGILQKLETIKEYLSWVSNLEIKLIKTEYSGIKLNQSKINLKENKTHRTTKTVKNSLNEFLLSSKILMQQRIMRIICRISLVTFSAQAILFL